MAAGDRPVLSGAVVDAEHRILRFDDRAGAVLVRAALARAVVGGRDPGCALHRAQRLCLFLRRPLACALFLRGEAGAAEQAVAGSRRRGRHCGVRDRRDLAAGLAEGDLRQSDPSAVSRAVRTHATEDVWGHAGAGRSDASRGRPPAAVDTVAGGAREAVLPALSRALADPVRT